MAELSDEANVTERWIYRRRTGWRSGESNTSRIEQFVLRHLRRARR